MPQLDILSFSSELIWFLLLFFTSFFGFLLFLLPNMYAVLRTREKRRYRLSTLVRSSEMNSKYLDSYSGKTLLSLSSASSLESVPLSPKQSFDRGYIMFVSILERLSAQRSSFHSSLIVNYYAFIFSQSADLDNFGFFLDSYKDA